MCKKRITKISYAFLIVVFLAATQFVYAEFIFEHNVPIPMRDGAKLTATIFRPEGEGQYPVILMRSPYGKPDKKTDEAKRYTEAGYVMVIQDCRGRGSSEGVWDPFAYDIQDGVDTQQWVGAQPWCNGEIGTAGGSYLGWTQWASAPDATKFLKCAVPIVPLENVYQDAAYYGGALQLALVMGWGIAVGGVSLNPEELQEAFKHLPLNTFGDQFDKKIQYLNDWVIHSTYDDYWKQRSIDYRYDEIEIPILNIGGWYDIFSKTTLEMVTKVHEATDDPSEKRSHFVVIGPWTHGIGKQKVGELDFGPDANCDIGELQFQWFEYWLKEKDTGVQEWPAYKLFIMGENCWRGENEWPLERTQYTPMYLHGKGNANSPKPARLSIHKPADEPVDTFVYDAANPTPTFGGNNLGGAKSGPYDQSAIEQRDDVLVYTTPPLIEPIEVTGPVKMILYAASTALDTDFTAKLVDVYPDGRAINLCDGILRARYRNGMDNPELLTPGAIELYEIDLWVTSNLFKEKHRIRVEISSSNFPRFDRNPNSGLPFGTDTELLTATQTIYHDAEHPSHILLPVIPR